jgi:GNAT superfamily N-acetyltransferase
MTGMSEWRKDGFLVTTDRKSFQIDRVHRFLSAEAYWCLGIPKRTVEKAMEGSLCFGLFTSNGDQIGLARVITDYATFAWICDVYVEKDYRGKGLSKWMIDCLMNHPDMAGLRRVCLATRDAHELYSRFGFQVTKTPGYWMEIKDNDLYLRGGIVQ